MKCHKCNKEVTYQEFRNDAIFRDEDVFHLDCYNEYEPDIEEFFDYIGDFNTWLMINTQR